MTIRDFAKQFDRDTLFRLNLSIIGERVEYDSDADSLAYEDTLDLEYAVDVDDVIVRKAHISHIPNNRNQYDIYVYCDVIGY